MRVLLTLIFINYRIYLFQLFNELFLFSFLNIALDYSVGYRLESYCEMEGPSGFSHYLSYVLQCLNLVFVIFVELLSIFNLPYQPFMLVYKSHNLFIDIKYLLFKMINLLLFLNFNLFNFTQRIIYCISV